MNFFFSFLRSPRCKQKTHRKAVGTDQVLFFTAESPRRWTRNHCARGDGWVSSPRWRRKGEGRHDENLLQITCLGNTFKIQIKNWRSYRNMWDCISSLCHFKIFEDVYRSMNLLLSKLLLWLSWLALFLSHYHLRFLAFFTFNSSTHLPDSPWNTFSGLII